MIKSTIPKADWDQHISIARYLHSKGLTASTTVAWFKAQHYTLKGKRYEATRVSAMIAGIELNTQPAVQYTLADMVAHINTGISNGELKYTKGKQVHYVPTKATVPAPIKEVDDAPF